MSSASVTNLPQSRFALSVCACHGRDYRIINQYPPTKIAFSYFLGKNAGKERQVLTLFHSKNSWNVYTMEYRLEIGKIMEEKSARLFDIFREILFIPICIRLSDT